MCGKRNPDCFAAAIALASVVFTIVPCTLTIGTPSLSMAGAAKTDIGTDAQKSASSFFTTFSP
jgi:hypothetical protein